MVKQQRILLYGKSVILGTVEASLKKNPQLEVLRVCTPYPGAAELEAMQPNVILFDMDNDRPEAVFPLLSTCPGLLLIGVNPERDDLLIVSAYHKLVQSVADLIDIVRKHAITRGDIHFNLQE